MNCFLPLQVPLVIVARNLIIPLLFKLAQLVEGLHPRAALKMMLLRYNWYIPTTILYSVRVMLSVQDVCTVLLRSICTFGITVHTQ